MFDHGVDIEAVYRHQVHVAELVRGGGDAEGEGVLRVHKEDAGRPAPGPGKCQQILWVVRGQIEIVDHVEVILSCMRGCILTSCFYMCVPNYLCKFDAERVGEPVHPDVVGQHVVQRLGPPGTVHLASIDPLRGAP